MSVRAESLQLRASVYREIRGYLDSQGFCEVSTPVRVRIPALEDTIDAIPAGSWWLRTSPELHMKRLIQAGAERIYQLGPCFRAGEHGRRHRSEFCMLEFYEGNADYRDILRRTQGLFRHVSRALAVTEAAFWGSEWEVLTVEEAFRRYTHISAVQAVEQGDFDYLLVDRIERHLGVGRPTVLIDYPTKLAALARRSPQNPEVAERWELYANGLELANAYSELVDAGEQRARFEESASTRAHAGHEVYPLDEAFLGALEAGMPPTGGIAIGVDRLIMAMGKTDNIADTLAFPRE